MLFDDEFTEQSPPSLRPETLTLNPFTKYADILRADYNGPAHRIRALVLNLYNPVNPVDMGYLMRTAVFEILHWYAKYGENDPTFMNVARHLL